MTANAALLAVVVGLPVIAAGACLALVGRNQRAALAVSVVVALLLALAATFAQVDVRLNLMAGRALVMTPAAQLGVQLIALMALGIVLALEREPEDSVRSWLPVLWLSVSGLTLALVLSELPLALLALVSSGLVWSFGLSGTDRETSRDAAMRYVALLALLLPLLVFAFHVAGLRSSATPEIDRVVLAFAVPGFGLLLGVMPLHAWALTLAGGTPRTMLYGAIGLVQTAGFVLLLRMLARNAWMLEGADTALIVGGLISAAFGSWLALSSSLDDPDDFLVYALVANAGFLLAGMGARSAAAGAGVVLLLVSRVLALVVLVLAPSVAGRLRKLAYGAGILTLAGTPALAGFPGLWLVVRRLPETTSPIASLVLLACSVILLATAARRWNHWPGGEPETETIGARRAVALLVALLVFLGLAPHWLAPAFTGAVQGVFFPIP